MKVNQISQLDRERIGDWTYVGYAERNSASEAEMHKLQNPAVTRPVWDVIQYPLQS